MTNIKTRTLCEAAVLVALAQLLSYVRLYHFPNGGSIDCAMLPIILFAVRHGCGWGTLMGFVYGLMQYVFGNGTSIDWTSLIADYLIAYTMLGFGASIGHGKARGVYWGTLCGGLLRFLVHFIVGAVVWGKYMPDSFFGMTMTSEWLYSFLYNVPYMIPSIALVLLLFALLYRPLQKYFRGEDLQ